ncbi:unnamed protein product [Closterium sp. NIES-54]
MDEEEMATDYRNRARRILATMRMAGVQYSTASYLTHVIKGLTSSYNLLKRLSLAPSTRATLNEDSLTSYILQDEAMQEAERPRSPLHSGWKPTKNADNKKSAKDSGRGGGSRRRECWLCGDPDHLSFECPDRSDSNDEDATGGRGRFGSCRPHRVRNQPRKEKLSTRSSTTAKDVDSSAGGKGQDDKEASCSLAGVVEPTISLAPEAAEDFQAMAAAVQANPAVVLLDSGCSHHLMGTKEVFVDLQPSGDVKHVRGFNGALQDVQGRGTVALQGEAGRQVLIPDVLYVPGVRANLLSAVLCTDLRPCSAKSTTPTTEVVALRAIFLVTKSTPDKLHARLAQVDMNTIQSWAKHEVATGLDLKSATGADLPCVSCVSRKLARHTFPDQGSDANDVLAVVHVDLCGPLRFVQWLAVTERQTKKSVLMLHSHQGGEFLGKQFTDIVNGNGIVHDLTCPYTPQQNSMAEREMRTVVESPGTTPYQLLTEKKPDLSLALVWGCMAQFLVPEQQRSGKLQPKARWGLHLGVSERIKGWELLDIADNRVVTMSDVVFYGNMSLDVWKSEHGPASGRKPTIRPTDTSTVTLPLLAEADELAAEDVEDVPSPFPSPASRAPPLITNLRGLTLVSASGDEGRSGASPVAPAKSIAGG